MKVKLKPNEPPTKPLTVEFVTFINGKLEVIERRELKPDPTIVVRRRQREG